VPWADAPADERGEPGLAAGLAAPRGTAVAGAVGGAGCALPGAWNDPPRGAAGAAAEPGRALMPDPDAGAPRERPETEPPDAGADGIVPPGSPRGTATPARSYAETAPRWLSGAMAEPR